MINNPDTLNLGSGENYVDGALNLDLYAHTADLRHDLDIYPYPFKDNSFDKIICNDIIEHLDSVISVMREIHRIAKHGSRVLIRVPHFRSACLYEDVTHKHGFAWRSFDIFAADGAIYGEYVSFRYRVMHREYTPYKVRSLYKLLSRMPVLTDNLLSKYVPMASIRFELQVLKDS